MRPDDCYQLGEVIKTHGLNGEISISLDVDFPETYQNLESVFLDKDGKLIPFFIESIQINGNKALVQLEDITSLDAAKSLVNSNIYLPLSQLPKLNQGQYYYHDLVNCEVFENEAKLGLVEQVIDLNGNQLIVMNRLGKEILIPIKDEILLQVDVQHKRILVKLPDGLLDVYND